MQNRYVGDIGDYLKLGILRTLSPGYHLGVACWLFSVRPYRHLSRRKSIEPSTLDVPESTVVAPILAPIAQHGRSAQCVGKDSLHKGLNLRPEYKPSIPQSRSPALQNRLRRSNDHSRAASLRMRDHRGATEGCGRCWDVVTGRIGSIPRRRVQPVGVEPDGFSLSADWRHDKVPL